MTEHILPRREAKSAAAFAFKPSSATPDSTFPLGAGLLLGLGVGGLFDGIVFHQILQWHHMLSSAGYPADSVANLEVNTLADGFFHASTYLLVLWGLGKLWHAARQPHFRWSSGLLLASMLMGFGLFNMVEGLVNHQILGIHHVNETVPPEQWVFWDIAFFVWGLSMFAGGLLLARRIQAAQPPNSRLASVMLATIGNQSDRGQRINLSTESVAGEEDPGASLDMSMSSSSNPPASGTGTGSGSQPGSDMSPGDEAPAGTPGTGENLCRECGGSGRLDGKECPSCEGSGKVTVGVGGA